MGEVLLYVTTDPVFFIMREKPARLSLSMKWQPFLGFHERVPTLAYREFMFVALA